MNYINSDKVTLSDKKSLILKWVKCLEALKVDTKSLSKDVNRICRIVDDRIAYNEANEKEKNNEQTIEDIINRKNNYKIELDNIKHNIASKKPQK